MRSARILISLFVLALGACKIRRLPELPADRDPVSPDAPVTPYAPPPDVLTKDLSTGAAEAAPEPAADEAPVHDHSGHAGHGGAP